VGWFKVTTTSGVSAYLNADNCLRIRANSGEHGEHAKSVIDLAGCAQVAMQSPEEMMEAIAQSGAASPVP
jgi:hypothetical protein